MKKICLSLTFVFCFVILTACNFNESINSDIASNYTSSAVTQSETSSKEDVSSETSSEIAKIETSSVSSTSSQASQSQITSSDKTSSSLVSKLPPVVSKPTLEEVVVTNKQKANEIILKNTNSTLTDVEKMKATYKWLYPHFRYRTASVDLSNGFTPNLEAELAAYYFKYRKGSCEHYAAAQKVMINEIGYECKYVVGERYSSISHRWGEHVWLMVNVNDNWYHVDGLFGGLFYNVIETTFMVPDSAIEKTHRWDKNAYPACTSPQLLK